MCRWNGMVKQNIKKDVKKNCNHVKRKYKKIKEEINKGKRRRNV